MHKSKNSVLLNSKSKKEQPITQSNRLSTASKSVSSTLPTLRSSYILQKDWITDTKDRISGSIYLKELSEEDRPNYVKTPLIRHTFPDPTETAGKNSEFVYHGGFFDPRQVKEEGILPFKNAMDTFALANPTNMLTYIKEAQERRVKGIVNIDPLYSTTSSIKQALRFAPRVKTNGIVPEPAINRIHEIYSDKNFRSSSKSLASLWYDCSFKGRKQEISVTVYLDWGLCSKQVINNLLETARQDLAKDIFGPEIGYLAEIKTNRGHSVDYSNKALGDYGSKKVDYTDEKEINLFGGVRGNEINSFLPVWGTYMNGNPVTGESNNFVLHTTGSGSRVLDDFANKQLNANKAHLKNPDNGRLKQWRLLIQKLGSMSLYKTTINALKNILMQNEIEMIVNASGVTLNGLDKIPYNGYLFELNVSLDDAPLEAGRYILKPGGYIEDNRESLEKDLCRASQSTLTLIQAYVEAGLNEFIDTIEILGNKIPRDIY